MIKIGIIGGGFGGVYAAKTLLKKFKNNPEVTITVISKTNYFLFIPMLHEVATGGLCGHNLAEPFREIFKARNFQLVKETVEHINLEKKKIKTKTTELNYDYIILATGSSTNFYNTPGADQYTVTLKSLKDAHKIKAAIVEASEKMCRSKNKQEQKKYATVAVIGAGATGIELAIEIKELMDQLLKSNTNCTEKPNILLLQSGSQILPQFPELQKDAEKALLKHNIKILLNNPVTEITKDKIKIKSGTTIDAATIVWTAGTKPNTILTTPSVCDARGYCRVNENLQLPTHPEAFAIGDCAQCIPKGRDTPLPALAQTATEQGKHAAKNIIRSIRGKPLKPFDYNLRGILISLGRRKGIGLIKGIKIRGFIAWWLMRTIYLFKIIGTVNKLKTAYDWTLNLFAKRDTCQYE